MKSILRKAVPNATTMIRMDHTHVLATFHRYRSDTPAQVKQGLINVICTALEVHAQLEEEIFYPAMRAAAAPDSAIVDKSLPEHEEMKRLIAKLRGMQPSDALYDDTVMELMRGVLHHVADEETTLLPDAERLLRERLEDLGLQMTKRRLELTVPRAGEIAVNTVRAIPATSMVLAAVAVVAGAYVVKRAMGRAAAYQD